MPVGGLHVFAGLFFLVCCMAMTLAYVYGVYVVVVALKKGLFKIRFYKARLKWMAGDGPNPSEIMSPPLMEFRNKRFLIKALRIIVLLLVVVYARQRATWMGNENTHYKAKEYYVAGQVVFAHRRIMEFAFHPENILIRPYTALQNLIFKCGIRYLSEDDGERYVWENRWFLYLYTQKMLRPFGVGDDKYEPVMVALLDRCWKSMEGMATCEINDIQMRREYYLGFPTLASYYSLYQGHFTGKLMGAGKIRRKTEYMIQRTYKTLHWLDQLKASWEKTGLMQEIKTKHPFVAACRQGTILDLLQDLALVIVSQGQFSCDHPLIERLYREYQDAMSDDPDRNYFLLYSRKNSRQAKMLYQPSVYGGRGSAANYLLSHICGKEMPVEKYNIVKKKDPYSCKFNKIEWVEEDFNEELKPLLKEKKHD